MNQIPRIVAKPICVIRRSVVPKLCRRLSIDELARRVSRLAIPRNIMLINKEQIGPPLLPDGATSNA